MSNGISVWQSHETVLIVISYYAKRRRKTGEVEREIRKAIEYILTVYEDKALVSVWDSMKNVSEEEKTMKI